MHEIDFIESALVIIFMLCCVCVCVSVYLFTFLRKFSLNLFSPSLSLSCSLSCTWHTYIYLSLFLIYVNIYIPTTHSIIYLCNKQFVVLVSCKRSRQSKMMLKILEFCSVEISQLIDIEVV